MQLYRRAPHARCKGALHVGDVAGEKEVGMSGLIAHFVEIERVVVEGDVDILHAVSHGERCREQAGAVGREASRHIPLQQQAAHQRRGSPLDYLQVGVGHLLMHARQFAAAFLAVYLQGHAVDGVDRYVGVYRGDGVGDVLHGLAASGLPGSFGQLAHFQV